MRWGGGGGIPITLVSLFISLFSVCLFTWPHKSGDHGQTPCSYLFFCLYDLSWKIFAAHKKWRVGEGLPPPLPRCYALEWKKWSIFILLYSVSIAWQFSLVEEKVMTKYINFIRNEIKSYTDWYKVIMIFQSN